MPPPQQVFLLIHLLSLLDLWFSIRVETGFWTALSKNNHLPPVTAFFLALLGLNTQESHFVLSRHTRQTCSGSCAFEYSSTTISNVWVMGLLNDHASLLKVALPSCDNSGVYAM
jgi:hypothetical protein